MVSVAGQTAILSFPFIMVIAGAVDVMSRRIPNELCSVLGASFFVFAVATGMPLWMIASHVITGTSLLLAGFCLFDRGWIGGGDAKLLAAAGLWLGFPAVLPFLLFSALGGGVLAMGMGLWFIATTEMRIVSAALDRALAPLAPDLPYGFALAAGAILTTPLTWWMVVATAQT